MNRQNLVLGDIDRITAIVQDYFDGLHSADLSKLERIFHPDATLKAPGLRRSLQEWLQFVGEREVPADLEAEFGYRILSLDIAGEQAMVKVLCPLLDRCYVDFLGLLKEDGHWLIVNKMYADF